MSYEMKPNPYFIFNQDEYIPIETFGWCINIRECFSDIDWLGDGYCVKCWDKGHSSEREKEYRESHKGVK